MNGDFLSPAEHNFFCVLRTTVSDQAVIGVNVKSKDPSEFLIYRNKIDRKHVDIPLWEHKYHKASQNLSYLRS